MSDNLLEHQLSHSTNNKLTKNKNPIKFGSIAAKG